MNEDLVLKKYILILKIRAQNIWIQEVSVLEKYKLLTLLFTRLYSVYNVIECYGHSNFEIKKGSIKPTFLLVKIKVLLHEP